MRWMADRAPFVLSALGIALSILAGRYRGLRLTELVRFRPTAVAENLDKKPDPRGA